MYTIQKGFLATSESRRQVLAPITNQVVPEPEPAILITRHKERVYSRRRSTGFNDKYTLILVKISQHSMIG